MRYYFDTEFIEDGRTIDLISIGMICEDGRELYLVSSEFDESKACPWVRANVLAQIPDSQERHTRKEIAAKIEAFTCEPLKDINPEGDLPESLQYHYMRPECWAYYADYDWVALCQLFGRMIDRPRHFPMYCRDIKQLCDSLGNPRLPAKPSDLHHALADARWNRAAHEFLLELKPCSF